MEKIIKENNNPGGFAERVEAGPKQWVPFAANVDGIACPYPFSMNLLI